MIEKITALLFMKGESERVPGKNMRRLCGIPLFHWILSSLTESGVIDKIVINTDSEEIANSARENFDVTIHMRPEYLREIESDEAYKIMAYDLPKIEGDYFLQTHSTNPLLRPDTIRNAVKIFFDNVSTNDSLLSVTPFQKRLYDGVGNPINHDPKILVKTQNLDFLYEENMVETMH